jgi:hypothetical protein
MDVTVTCWDKFSDNKEYKYTTADTAKSHFVKQDRHNYKEQASCSTAVKHKQSLYINNTHPLQHDIATT